MTALRNLQVGLLAFPHLTQLDLTGPAEVFGNMPETDLHFAWKTADPVPTSSGFRLCPTVTFRECPRVSRRHLRAWRLRPGGTHVRRRDAGLPP